jgi:dihydrofolate reductase
MVAAYADNRVIGSGGGIPWHIPEDMRHFRATTTGHTVVMGRTTYEGIGHPLPYRTNIVLTRDRSWSADGVVVAHALTEALEIAQRFDGDVMIGGGAQVYAEAMPLATHQVLTLVHQTPPGDAFYPEFDPDAWQETRREDRDGFTWSWLERT